MSHPISARRALLCATMLSAALGLGAARAAEPIKIGVISEEAAVAGAGHHASARSSPPTRSTQQGGVNGRKIEIIAYDDHSSAADAVRAFQRAVQQDHVNAVIASYISEVVLAIEPWAARLHMPTITPGAASNDITKRVHDDYANYKYMFQGWLTSAYHRPGGLRCLARQPGRASCT